MSFHILSSLERKAVIIELYDIISMAPSRLYARLTLAVTICVAYYDWCYKQPGYESNKELKIETSLLLETWANLIHFAMGLKNQIDNQSQPLLTCLCVGWVQVQSSSLFSVSGMAPSFLDVLSGIHNGDPLHPTE
eukprot:Ihof_evm1s222 gene=Ihof_evmTU1s222